MTEGGVGAAYDAAAAAWRAGPAQMYARLAEAMADHAPVDVRGARVLDAGAGTGVAGEALRRRGARSVVAVDLAPGMLAASSAPAVVGDLIRLPFCAGSFELAAAAFSLNHFADPTPAMAELRRVAGALLATVFAPGWDHPAKEAVDAVMARHGFAWPEWYAAFKAGGGDGDPGPAELEALAGRAGYRTAGARVVEVDTGLGTPADLVDWRTGMAHLAPWIATLAPDERARARQDAEDAVAGMPPLVVPIVVLSATG
ncbi:class I SAM-dependent methyltransferase [Nocardioides antri]|uniref:Class I SAM-dependent methyltransferase n=1 Tax=Nocardioides antri TaxID=2607659 RepID=A0A5B1M669_9ACTN|nr:class I SAM-dependent methyltransferase [Nocardioides antri]KAA1427287.1 class I SAM-dependent methyltransferase [Nocardioides antri]